MGGFTNSALATAVSQAKGFGFIGSFFNPRDGTRKGVKDSPRHTRGLRYEVSPMAKICVKIGSVAAALRVAELVEPDVLVMQGLDAGGHGWEKGVGIISQLPEAADVLAENGLGHIHLLAAGGIVDGRGVAAALALGAEGVVMGTRFLSAPEKMLPHPRCREMVSTTTDGGQNTVRAKSFDELNRPNILACATCDEQLHGSREGFGH